MPKEPRRFARTLRHFETAAENILWQALRGRKLAGLKFKRQEPFLAYTVDFLCFERKLVVELDGRQHDWFDAYDVRRTEEIERFGFVVLRLRNDEVRQDLELVLSRIRQAIVLPEETAHPHPRPLSHPGEGGQ